MRKGDIVRVPGGRLGKLETVVDDGDPAHKKVRVILAEAGENLLRLKEGKPDHEHAT